MNALLAALLATRVLSLQDALTTADKNAPALRESIASADAAQAAADQARAPLLPQVSATAQWTRNSNNSLNFVQHQPISYRMWDSASFGATGSQVLFDAGTYARWRAAVASARSSSADLEFARMSLHETVRANYFTASADKALVKVKQDALDNKQKHLQQVQGFVNAGSKPEIDLALARGDVASAKFDLVTAQASYTTALQVLEQTLGTATGVPDFDVSDEALPAVDGEDASVDELMATALRTRPDLIARQKVVDADSLAVKAAYAGYLPTITGDARANSAGDERAPGGLNYQVPNVRVDLIASWSIFNGLLTTSQVREASANLRFAQAARDALEQQVRLEVQNARLAIDTGKAQTEDAAEALANMEERLRLAEARYQTGAGSIIELADAQLARDQAAQQKVQAEFTLATARAQLLQALARP